MDSLAHAVELGEEEGDLVSDYFYVMLQSFEEFPIQPDLPEGMAFLLPILNDIINDAAEAWEVPL